jgi:indoleamine 2,3-dioxygenase
MAQADHLDMLSRFEVDQQRGFLPSEDPLERLPAAFDDWEIAALGLPKLLVSGRVRSFIEALPGFPTDQLVDDSMVRRAMMVLSYLGHAYVWGEAEPAPSIPSVLSVPWFTVGQKCGRPPILSYASYALDNWRRLDPTGPIELDNIALLQNFLGGLDEEWFILIHVDIEAKAAPALSGIIRAQDAVGDDDPVQLESALHQVEKALGNMYSTLERMPECCDPFIYYRRVRPYIHGWKNHPALPSGLVYEAVEEYGGTPQRFRGETGAQSSIIPAIDAALNVSHEDDPLKEYLVEMREYMPPRHREFIAFVESRPKIREFVMGNRRVHPSIVDVYNACVRWVERFRALHLEYAATYIFRQAQTGASNPADVGTGGTPFMKYLKKHRDETSKHVLPHGGH